MIEIQKKKLGTLKKKKNGNGDTKVRKIDKVQTESSIPRASTRYTLAKSVFSPRKPRGTISIESIYEFTRGKPPPRGGTNACPPFRAHRTMGGE